MRFILLFIGFLGSHLYAQPLKTPDQLIQVGDTMILQRYDADERLVRERYYVHGTLLFVRDWDYSFGALNWSQKSKLGKYASLDGPTKSYYPDGKLMSSQTYHRGNLIGDCLHYYPSGMLRIRCHHGKKGRTRRGMSV
ncbi:MAG: hypothetical protein ABIO24_03885 [Saprospiraceae bacterium]